MRTRLLLLSSHVLVVSLGLGFVGVIAACSDHVEKADVCAGNPKAKGCKQTSDAGASSATTYGQPDAGNGMPATPPTANDGGKKADGGGSKTPSVPPASTACLELTKCCAKVKDTVERAACAGIAINQDSGVCANAIVAYQVFGGCGHSPLSLPDIYNSDKTPSSSKNCDYLKRACANDPSRCDAALTCGGADVPGTATPTSTSTDPCAGNADEWCCRYPDDEGCSGSPGAIDACANVTQDRYCCEFPNDFDCGGSPPPTDDPPTDPPPEDPSTDPPPDDPGDPGECWDCW